MAAGTKGTQTLAGLSKKPDWAKPKIINPENTQFRIGTTTTTTGPNAPESIGNSFNKMMGGSPQMGGGMGGMRDLEAASMRLADAASKREMQEFEYKMKLNKALELGYSSIEEMEKKLGRESFSAKTSAGNSTYDGMRTFKWAGGESVAAA